MLVFSQIWFQLFVLLEQLFLAYIGLLVLIYAARLINATLTNLTVINSSPILPYLMG